MQVSPAFQHWHQFVEHRCFTQPHFTISIIASGAGGGVIITGSHSLSFFQPHFSGDRIFRYLMVSSSGYSVVARFARTVITSSSALSKTFWHPNFLFPEKLSVSALLKAWKAGRAAALAAPREWEISLSFDVFGLYQLRSRCFGRGLYGILGTTQRHLCLVSGFPVYLHHWQWHQEHAKFTSYRPQPDYFGDAWFLNG